MNQELDLKAEQRLLQVSRVLALMLEDGLSQQEAVEQVPGMSLATFKRWLPRFEDQMREAADYARGQLLAAMLRAAQSLPDAVEKQIELATGQAGESREWPKGYDRLLALAERLAGMSPAPEEEPEEFSPSFKPLDGAETMIVHFGDTKVELHKGQPPIIDATALPDHGQD